MNVASLLLSILLTLAVCVFGILFGITSHLLDEERQRFKSLRYFIYSTYDPISKKQRLFDIDMKSFTISTFDNKFETRTVRIDKEKFKKSAKVEGEFKQSTHFAPFRFFFDFTNKLEPTIIMYYQEPHEVSLILKIASLTTISQFFTQ